ncbi:rhomboid family intramembrane serine protease [Nocardia panacis]|uniref:rhomboid family intramembrane serine protease n=1 Tax=Nocardia panacis TaxID=2340916 RepID=UPI0013159041|nr:rhomboid family intramembrane serine protease [Nocardia panacis]
MTVAAYIAEVVVPGFVDRFEMVGQALQRDGRLYVYQGGPHPGSELVGVAHGEWYRLLTAGFLHQQPLSGFGITHIIFNMMWLFMLGRLLEPVLGHLWFALTYLGSILGGSLLSYALAPDSAGLGASGAVYGLVAAYFVLSRHFNADRSEARGLVIFFLIWLVISAAFASWQAHLGGFLAGGVIALVHIAFRSVRRSDATPPATPQP